MKTIIQLFVAAIILTLASCSSEGNKFKLTGSFKNLQQGEFLCFSESPEWGTLDTVKVKDGEFTLEHPLTDTVIITLQYPNFMQTQIIAIPGEHATLKGDANSMKRITVSGEENDELSDFRKSVVKLKDEEVPAKAEAFIRENPHLWASIALLQKYFLQVKEPDYAKIKSLFDPMIKIRPERKALLAIQAQISPLLTCRVGSKLPKFKATTINGAEVSNASFAHKAVLITFWSTVTNEFQYPLINQRHLMRRLSDQITQLNICLDADTTQCNRVLRTDTIGGYNVCDRLTFDSPLVSLLGAPRLPANILVDAKGVIKARDIKPDQLQQTLEKFGIK